MDVVIKLTTTLLVFLAIGLSMDACAVSISNGMCYRINPLKNALAAGMAFGLFQGLMPLIGYFAGHTFSHTIENMDHWIALVLLSIIGGKMIIEAIHQRRHPSRVVVKAFTLPTLIVQAVATSIDALAVGVGLGVMQVNVYIAVSVIAAITFGFSFCGVLIGKKFGGLLQDKAEILGGLILILIGVHLFWEHMGILFH